MAAANLDRKLNMFKLPTELVSIAFLHSICAIYKHEYSQGEWGMTFSLDLATKSYKKIVPILSGERQHPFSIPGILVGNLLLLQKFHKKRIQGKYVKCFDNLFNV